MQTFLAMLLNGGPDLPERVPVLSPWIGSDLGIPAYEVAASLVEQTARCVVKTRTPADGFPVWDGVAVIVVYRHPLDVFFSLWEHIANTKFVYPDHAMRWPASQSFRLRICEAAVRTFRGQGYATLARGRKRVI